jgi:hypothetical protein
MLGYGATDGGAAIGKLTNASFSLGIENLASTSGVALAVIEFTWFGENSFVTNTSDSFEPRFVPDPGEEPRFFDGHAFGARGYIDVPLDGVFLDDEEEPFLAFGDPFVLNATVGANSSCGNEIPSCLAISRFFTVRIENARIVDQFGDPVPGASFDSASGYDYDVAPAPEPDAAALMLAAVATIASLRGRLRARSVLRLGDAVCHIA